MNLTGRSSGSEAALRTSEQSEASHRGKPEERHTYYLIYWVASLAVVFCIVLKSAWSPSPDAELVLRVAFDAAPLLAMLMAACYVWILFHTGREMTWLFATLGLVAGVALTLVHATALLATNESVEHQNMGMAVLLTLSRFVPAVLLAVAAFSTATVPAGRTKIVAARSLVIALCGTALLLMAAIRIENAAPQIGSAAGRLNVSALISLHWGAIWRHLLVSFHTIGLFAASGAFALATIGYWRRARLMDDGMAATISYWLASMSLAALADALGARLTWGSDWLASGTMACLGAASITLVGSVQSGLAYRLTLRRTMDLEAVHAITSALVGVKRSEQSWESVASAVAGALQARFACLFVAMEDDLLSLVAAHGFEEPHDGLGRAFPLASEARSGFHTSNTARAFREREIIVLHEAVSECDFVPWRMAARTNGYVVCLPIVRGGRSLGVLDLMYPTELSEFALRTNLFEMITGVLAPTIEALVESASYIEDEELSKAA